MKVLRADLSVGLVRNQPRNRGENSLVPNWMMRRTMEVTNPGKREHAAAERAERRAGASGTDSPSEDNRIVLVPPQEP